ncbi:uncharacterized protein LOC123270768 [Cotesia glomerata]|uniref:uncharacterized protein LOC123270768 n=1 Tax=Cotesia glomerata TaxID=32391 RepID=UPI001D01734C|nr:uncharacterized protein LOC123270768 [Cotesia glomerata]
MSSSHLTDDNLLLSSNIQSQLPRIRNNRCNLRQYRTMTIETQKIHKAKLAKFSNELKISKIDDSNVANFLKTIQDKSRSDKKLSKSYVNAIYSTLKLLNPSLTKTASEMDFPRKNRKFSSDEYLDTISGVKKVVEQMTQFTESFKNIEIQKVESRRKIDTMIAITMTALTNLRTTELLQLELKHLYQIAHGIPITLKLSYNKEQIIDVLLTDILTNQTFKNIINMVLSRELWCKNNFNSESQIKQSCIKLISCKNDTINKTFSELYVQINNKKPKLTLGLKSVRSHNSARIVYQRIHVTIDSDDETIFESNINNFIKENRTPHQA